MIFDRMRNAFTPLTLPIGNEGKAIVVSEIPGVEFLVKEGDESSEDDEAFCVYNGRRYKREKESDNGAGLPGFWGWSPSIDTGMYYRFIYNKKWWRATKAHQVTLEEADSKLEVFWVNPENDEVFWKLYHLK